MTLQQLRYVTTVAETGTMSEAARRLFVSQPGLTKAIRELEQEMGIIIFDRTNKGIEVSKDGAIFLGYARQVLEQASLLEERYKLQAGGKKEFRCKMAGNRLRAVQGEGQDCQGLQRCHECQVP